MTSIPSKLQLILEGVEGEHHEFKEWKTKDDFDGLTKYACALANEGGGKLVLGVADQRPRRIVGTQVWPQIEVGGRKLVTTQPLLIDTLIRHKPPPQTARGSPFLSPASQEGT